MVITPVMEEALHRVKVEEVPTFSELHRKYCRWVRSSMCFRICVPESDSPEMQPSFPRDCAEKNR